MANWEIERPIDYSPNGDDVDLFAQKTKATFEQIFILLNMLRSNGAVAGTDVSGDIPFSWHIDTTTGTIYMVKLDENNEKVLVEMGSLAPYFGITPEAISAMRNKGGMASFRGGVEANMPTSGNNTYDWYWAYDTSRVFMWTGTAWRIILSLNFKDILNYEQYCVARTEVSEAGGKGKIPRLDRETGKGNFDIAGSPERLLGLLIETQDLRDDHVLVYDEDKQKIVNKPRNDINWDDLTYTGEARKVVAVSEDGTIHANLTGSASKVGGIKANTSGIENGQVLIYDQQSQSFIPGKAGGLSKDDIAQTEEDVGKIVALNENGRIPFSITGNAGKLLSKNVLTDSGIEDGQTLVYRESINSWHPENKGSTIGQGKALTITNNGDTVLIYDGSAPITTDLGVGIVSRETIQQMVDGTYVPGQQDSNGEEPGGNTGEEPGGETGGEGGNDEPSTGGNDQTATDGDIQEIIDNLYGGD